MADSASASGPGSTSTSVASLAFCQPQWMSIESYSLLLLLLSAMLFSTMGVFLKLASNSGIPATELVFFRAIFQGFFIVIGLSRWQPSSQAQGGPHYSPHSTKSQVLLQTPFGGTRQVQKVVVARGMFGGLGFVMYFFTIKSLPLGDAITLFSIYPIITIFLAATFLGEPIRSIHIMATGASLVGAILITRPTFIFGIDETAMAASSATTYSWIGYVTAIIGSFCGAIVMTLIRKAGKVGAHTLQLLWSWAFFGISCSIFFGMQRWVQRIDGVWYIPSTTTSPMIWWYLLGMGTVGSVAHFLMNYAGRMAPAGLGSIVRSSDILWAYMWEVIIFRELPAPITLAGVALILASLTMIAIQKFHDERKKHVQQTGVSGTATIDGMLGINVKYGSIDDATNTSTG